MSNALESFKKALVNQWPVAYAELRDSQPLISRLKEHSVNTGIILPALFKNQLKIVENKTRAFYNWREGEIFEFAKILGLLHDIGKSSNQYKSEFLEKKFETGPVKVSFHHHEFAAGMLIAVTLVENPDKIARRKAILLMQTILRHHAAMINRLTDQSCSRITEIAAKIEKPILEDFLRECAEHPICSVRLDDYETRIKRRGESYCRQGLLTCSGQQTWGEDSVHEVFAVKVLTGLLVVADNLAAACERKALPHNLPSYVEDWMRELGLSVDEIGADDPEACIDRIISGAPDKRAR